MMATVDRWAEVIQLFVKQLVLGWCGVRLLEMPFPGNVGIREGMELFIKG